MRFYERIGPIFAELVPLAHDLLYYMARDEDVEREIECEAFRTNFGRYEIKVTNCNLEDGK